MVIRLPSAPVARPTRTIVTLTFSRNIASVPASADNVHYVKLALRTPLVSTSSRLRDGATWELTTPRRRSTLRRALPMSAAPLTAIQAPGQISLAPAVTLRTEAVAQVAQCRARASGRPARARHACPACLTHHATRPPRPRGRPRRPGKQHRCDTDVALAAAMWQRCRLRTGAGADAAPP